MGFPFSVVIIVAIVIAGLAVIVGVTDNRRTVGVFFRVVYHCRADHYTSCPNL